MTGMIALGVGFVTGVLVGGAAFAYHFGDDLARLGTMLREAEELERGQRDPRQYPPRPIP